jgi:hypothetical protein
VADNSCVTIQPPPGGFYRLEKPMLLTFFLASGQFLFLLLSNLVTDLIGFVVVAIAIPFRVNGISKSDGRPIVNLPRWAWLFGNDYDGLLGDSHGTWAASTPWGLPVDSFISMYTWAALRNPVENMRFLPLWSCPLSECVATYKGQSFVRDKPESVGWQFVTIKRKAGGWMHWYSFYWVHAWNDTNALVVRFGFKVNPTDDFVTEPDAGMTTKIDLYKAI